MFCRGFDIRDGFYWIDLPKSGVFVRQYHMDEHNSIFHIVFIYNQLLFYSLTRPVDMIVIRKYNSIIKTTISKERGLTMKTAKMINKNMANHKECCQSLCCCMCIYKKNRP